MNDSIKFLRRNLIDVVTKLADAFADIIQGTVRVLFFVHALVFVIHDDFPRADIQHAVVQAF